MEFPKYSKRVIMSVVSEELCIVKLVTETLLVTLSTTCLFGVTTGVIKREKNELLMTFEEVRIF